MDTKVSLTADTLRAAVADYCRRKGVSKAALAKSIGINGATLSNIEHNWDSVSEEMRLRVWNYVRPTEWQAVNTTNFRTVFAVCEEARAKGRMLGIIGSTGYGKTTALRAFEQDNKQVYYLTCQKSMRAKQFFQKMLQTMGVYATGNIYELIERIAAELNTQAQPLVLIDEAGKLTPMLIQYLHDLRNLTEGHAGLVLAGVEYFKTNLEKAVLRQKEGMPEFFDRIAAWEFLATPTAAEKRNVCHANGLTDLEAVKQACKVSNYRALANSIGNELSSL